MSSEHISSSFDEFLKERGIYQGMRIESCLTGREAVAAKRILVLQIIQAIKGLALCRAIDAGDASGIALGRCL